MQGTVIAVCRSERTGTKKEPCGEGVFIEDYGLERDAHASRGIARQVSLLAEVASTYVEVRSGQELLSITESNVATRSGTSRSSVSAATRLTMGTVSGVPGKPTVTRLRRPASHPR